ncbi:MAG TPA: efflux RND transporter periplasmic adaptor subunit [Gemmatimonadales bacterium]
MTDRHAIPRLLPGILLVAAASASGCGRPSGAAAEAQAPATATVGAENILVLAARTLRAGPSLSGELVPERVAVIRAEVAGSIVRVAVEAGQAVTAGQLLGAIDESVVTDQHRSARMSLLSAENAAQVAAKEWDRAQRLAAGGAIAERDLEIAERTRVATDAQLENARAVLAGAERQLQKTRLRAPFAGVVSERTVSEGDVVQTGNPLFTVVDPSSMRLEAMVPVSALAELKVGSLVEFHVSGYEGQVFAGQVQRINPAVDPGTRQVRITVAIPNRGSSLVAGLFARGRVTAEERDALAVPIAALDQRGALPTLRRIRGGKVETVAVTLGLRDEVLEMVEILSGVAAGDSILQAGAGGLAPGTAVVVTKE